VEEIVFGFGALSTIDEKLELLRLAQLADREGLDVFSLSDHPFVGDRLDAYATLGFVLGATRRLTGFVNVTNLPTRPPVMLSRTVTTLSALSGGRFVFGIGAGRASQEGGMWDRITDMGVPPLSPGDAVDALEEAIVLVKKLSGGGPPVTHSGRHYQVREVEPAPVPAPSVWIGSVGPKSLAATGRLADGWLPGLGADWLSTRYRESRPVIDEAAASAGRDPREIRTVFNLPGRITDQPLAATRGQDGEWLGGSVEQWVEELTVAVLEHGASGFMFFTHEWAAPDEVSLGRWAAEIAPAVREAVTKNGA
jgi:alkanesulfonate monooxygenase SsuD/methylene tetrahydromethanopterin reductase-like flavin-dependent oxidoreductase (luciferase family)